MGAALEVQEEDPETAERWMRKPGPGSANGAAMNGKLAAEDGLCCAPRRALAAPREDSAAADAESSCCPRFASDSRRGDDGAGAEGAEGWPVLATAWIWLRPQAMLLQRHEECGLPAGVQQVPTRLATGPPGRARDNRHPHIHDNVSCDYM